MRIGEWMPGAMCPAPRTDDIADAVCPAQPASVRLRRLHPRGRLKPSPRVEDSELT